MMMKEIGITGQEKGRNWFFKRTRFLGASSISIKGMFPILREWGNRGGVVKSTRHTLLYPLPLPQVMSDLPETFSKLNDTGTI